MTIQCCKCKKVRTEGGWNAGEKPAGDAVSHTYCPTCLGEAMEAFRRAPRLRHWTV